MHAPDERSMARPMSVEQIVRKAQDFEYNPLIPFKYWIRTAGTLLKEAEIYEHEGNDQQTYLLLYRHAELVIKNLSASLEATQSQNREALNQARRAVNANLKTLEILKPRINRRFERYEQLIRDRENRESVKASLNAAYAGTSSINEKHYASEANIAHGAETLAAGENRDLAVQLAHKEIRRRATARKATRQAGISEEVEHERRGAGLWGNWEEALSSSDNKLDRDTLSEQMQKVNAPLRDFRDHEASNNVRRPNSQSNQPQFRYPKVPEKLGPQEALEDRTFPNSRSQSISTSQKPPKPPPKDSMLSRDTLPPSRPNKVPHTLENSKTSVSKSGPQDLKPSGFTFKPAAYLENGTSLRTVFLPPDLRHQFLRIAEPNTRANLETCGILCGTLISNALFISKLVIPEQESTSDTCETVNESDFFDYVDGEDLIVLGWIHTHPTQTCFMSSRDLHTHGGYQVMLPESVAIVCAPSKGEWGIFRLTDPPGMRTILNCTQTGLFHPHAENHLYTDALRPGHVYEAKGLEFDVVDLRPT